MIAYQKITLAGAPVGVPGLLPTELVGLADTDLADLSWVDPGQGYSGFGYIPVEVDDPRPSPHRLPKVDFWRLFTGEEETAFNRARRRVSGLTDADYDDPAKAGLVALERFLNRFDATPIVEVDHPETQAAIDLLVILEILTPERAVQAKLGERP
jgi:hypothetical protein